MIRINSTGFKNLKKMQKNVHKNLCTFGEKIGSGNSCWIVLEKKLSFKYFVAQVHVIASAITTKLFR